VSSKVVVGVKPKSPLGIRDSSKIFIEIVGPRSGDKLTFQEMLELTDEFVIEEYEVGPSDACKGKVFASVGDPNGNDH
jgi:hypothetical protein